MKVALCFIISYEHVLNKEQLWINWIKENQDIINVYFHYKDYSKIQSPWIKMYSIPPKYVHPTTYYNVVPAYMSLLTYAFHHDLENKWFCMLTDSCVPIISPAKFRQLFFENYKASIFKWKPAYWNIDIHRRANLRLLQKEYQLANDPWFTLSRAHVHKCIIFLAAKNSIYQLVNEGGLANESIFAIILQTFNELANSSSLINSVSTVTDWSRMSSPTSPYLFKDASAENINIISNLLKENPTAMFLRKVDRAFPDHVLLNLMASASNSENNAFAFNSKSNNDALLSAPQDHGYFMCIMASLFLLSGIYAFTRGNYEFAIGPLGVWINSVNYWRKPTYGLRRNIDICWVLFALTCTAFNAYKSIHGLTWTYIMFSSLLVFYPLGWLLYMYEYFWLATIAHSMLHVFPNLANVILYSGLSCETS